MRPHRCSFLKLAVRIGIVALGCHALSQACAEPAGGKMVSIHGSLAKEQPKTGVSAARDGVMTEDTQLKMRDGFGAQFWVTDSDAFYLNWLRTDTHNLEPVTLTRRGVPLYLAIFLLDPGVQRTRRGLRNDVTFDYQVLGPDGGSLDAGRNFLAWASHPLPVHLVQLAGAPAEHHGDRLMRSYPQIMFGDNPPGEYIVNVLVHDNIKKVEISLQRKIVLQE